MPPMHAQGTVLHSVKLRGAASDALRARLHLERVLAEVDWAAGLPPQALLFVRRLVADARPGLRRSGEGGRFAEGVSAALRQHARTARRPWLHADAAAADAVCFADEAELVACLLRDWARGTVAQRWWWQEVLGPASVLRWLRAEALAQAPRLVPALALLASRGEAVEAVARIDEADALQAWRAVRQAYGLRDDAATRGEGAGPPITPSRFHAMDEATAVSTSATSRAAALGQLLLSVPEVTTSVLRPAQRMLLAGALSVVREPAWSRSPALTQALEQLVQPVCPIVQAPEEVPGPALAAQPTSARPLTLASGVAGQAAPAAAAMPTPRSAMSSEHAVAPSSPERLPLEHLDASIGPLPERFVHPAGHEVSALAAAEPSLPSASSEAPDAPLPALPAKAARPSSRRKAAASDVPVEKATVRTRYGGIFYLLNAAMALKVYGDFTMPRAPGLSLSPWNLLAWTGRAWFGADFVHDPVWALLAQLSGRSPEDDPSRHFNAPDRWEAEADWLAPWGPVHELHVRASTQRLRIFHAEGFAVFDVLRDGALTPLQQAHALCAGRLDLSTAALRRARSPVARVPAPAAARWLHHWRCHLEARLQRTLGVDDAATLVCCHDAVVEAGLATVDVHFALATLPLPIRFAGLDRDPGWIPAAGRSLMFRFA